MAVVPVVTKIAAAPIKEILQARAQEIDEAEENSEYLEFICTDRMFSRSVVLQLGKSGMFLACGAFNPSCDS